VDPYEQFSLHMSCKTATVLGTGHDKQYGLGRSKHPVCLPNWWQCGNHKALHFHADPNVTVIDNVTRQQVLHRSIKCLIGSIVYSLIAQPSNLVQHGKLKTFIWEIFVSSRSRCVGCPYSIILFLLAVKGNVLFAKIICIIFLLGDNDFKILK
jgi:hypothetical protein